MNIVSGDKVLMEFSTFGDRILSIVADVREDGRILVYVPLPPQMIDRLKTDSSARLRFASEGRLKGFSTQVLNHMSNPGSLLELAAPGEIYDAEKRAEPRCPCRFPGRLESRGKGFPCVVEDMSASHARVRFLDGGWDAEGSVEEREARLTFHPFAQDRGYSVNCEVHTSFLKNGSQYCVLHFSGEDGDARRKIEEFVEAQLQCGLPRL